MFWGSLQDSLAAAGVKQSLGMSADQFIAARVSSRTKDLLRMLAQRQQISESALLKRVLETMLDAVDEPDVGDDERVQQTQRAARLYVRLYPDDRGLLAERARGRGMAPATYIAVLVRAHLRQLTPIPRDELQALKRSVAELSAIGRNLNQIARAAHQGAAVAGPRREEVMTMLRICEALRDHFKAMLTANARSWEVGHAPPRP